MNESVSSFMDQVSNFTEPGIAISVTEISYCLILSFFLTLIVAKTYQLTYRGVSFSPAFMHTLVICGMVIGAVMLIIGSNIARAFSLVGALSIIRFRNAVKDPRDVAYIFLAMGVGMGAGTGFYRIAIALTLIVCGCAIFLYLIKFGEHDLTEKVLRIQLPMTDNFENLFNDVLKNSTEHFNLISTETTRMGTELELTYAIRVAKKFSNEKLINDLKKFNENLRIQIMGANHVLDL